MCVSAYLPAPTATLPSTGPEHLFQLNQQFTTLLENLTFTGALALISLYCNYLFTHLPLHQTANSPHPPEDRRRAVSDAPHKRAHSRRSRNVHGKDEDGGCDVESLKIQFVKVIRSLVESFNLSRSKYLLNVLSWVLCVVLGEIKASDPPFIQSFVHSLIHSTKRHLSLLYAGALGQSDSSDLGPTP